MTYPSLPGGKPRWYNGQGEQAMTGESDPPETLGSGAVGGSPLRPGLTYVTDGGLETDLIFHHGVDLPEFAAFPLVRTAQGRRQLEDYFTGYAVTAAAARAGLVLETPTWRASSDWGERLGWSADEVTAVNEESVAQLGVWAERHRARDGVRTCSSAARRAPGRRLRTGPVDRGRRGRDLPRAAAAGARGRGRRPGHRLHPHPRVRGRGPGLGRP